MRVAVVTVITNSYLPYARVLMESVAQYMPEAARYAVLVDKPDQKPASLEVPFEIIPSDTLDIPGTPWFYFKYTALELNMALKPHAIAALFARGFEGVLYFDSDIRVYRQLSPITAMLGSASLILTPHLTRPIEEQTSPTYLDIVRAGAYNAGFVAVRNCEEGDRFVAWWSARLQDQCLVDYPNGLFVDQRWLDLAPGLFPGTAILREEGYNVGYWNLGTRPVQKQGDGYSAGPGPLYFFHFSGFDPEAPEGISRHQDRLNLKTVSPEERELFLDYARDVLASGYKQFRTLPYAYGLFENGQPISDTTRRAYYESPELVERVPNPFSLQGQQALAKFWNAAPQAASNAGTPLPRLARSIYDSRPDVQREFRQPEGADRLRFLTWMLTSGAAEHRIQEEFLAPLREEWETAVSRLNPLEQARQRALRWALARRSGAR